MRPVARPTCAPTNENLMELLIFLDCLRRASAARITAVIPYFGYARQDRRPRAARVPITAKVVAQMIGNVKADRVLTVDLHADQIQGFFDIPVDNVYASPILLGEIWRQKYPGMVVVSPDVGGVVRARAIAKRLDDAELAIIEVLSGCGKNWNFTWPNTTSDTAITSAHSAIVIVVSLLSIARVTSGRNLWSRKLLKPSSSFCLSGLFCL
mgnify:CR=1 FL=1